MKRLRLALLGATAGLAVLGFWALPALAGGDGGQRVTAASAAGVVKVAGRDAIVEVLVAVPDGADPAAAARAALHRNYPEALPLSESAATSGYTFTGMVWDTLPVDVNYNGAGAAISSARTELDSAMNTWTSVSTSTFVFNDAGTTNRCPSLVQECRGPQTFDGNNDIGWLDIRDPSVLGVTWYSTGGTDEFDMAIDNRNFTWTSGCSGMYNLQTVYLHELGHALGLGHSSDPNAVMYAYYHGALCNLTQDDINGVTALYPSGGGSAPTPTATPVVSEPTPTPTPDAGFCPPGQAKRGAC